MKPVLYLFRAMPGAGKSTIIDKYSLKSNTISLDSFRELYSGLSIDNSGSECIDQKYNEYIMKPFFNAVHLRMKEHATIIIDNLNLSVRNINEYASLAEKYNYDVKVVQFKLETLEFYQNRNNMREERKRLPKDKIEILFEKFSKIDISDAKADIIDLCDFEKEMRLTNKEKAINLDCYDEVVIVGDVMGASESLNDVVTYFDPSKFYIFTGAIFGDCSESENIIHLMNLGLKTENVVLLRSKSDIDFVYSNENESNLILKNELVSILDKSVSYFTFSYDKQFYFVSHAGVSKVPRKPELINHSVFTKKQEIKDIDILFETNENDNWIQIHGSIQRIKRKSTSSDISISLYDDVEKGGFIRTLIVDKNQTKLFDVINNKPSKKGMIDFFNSLFKNYSESKDIELSNLQSSGKIGLLKIFKDQLNTYYFFDENIIRIESNNKNQINVSFEKIEQASLSFSKAKNEYQLFDFNGHRLDFNINHFKEEHLKLALAYDCILYVVFKDDVFHVVSGIKKDKKRNKIKPKYFESFNSKIINFDNEKSFNKFKKGMKKANKLFYVVQ